MRDSRSPLSRWGHTVPRPRRAARAAAAAGLLAVAVAGISGCAARAGAAAAIQVATAYVPVPQTPGTTVAYVVIHNNGPADRLIAVHASAGGRVVFGMADGPQSSGLRILHSVRIPAHGTLAMVPDGIHMVITGAGPMRGGKDITLTLVFARAGKVPVVAQVTNPATGGSSYFLN
jgi:periplasmic copper chaperone A